MRGLKADDARTTLRDHLTTIMAQVLRWHDTLVEIASGDFVRPTPPHVAIRITTGTGKSALIRQAIAWFIAEASDEPAAPRSDPAADAPGC